MPPRVGLNNSRVSLHISRVSYKIRKLIKLLQAPIEDINFLEILSHKMLMCWTLERECVWTL
jgi:hypothetical protein